MKTTAALHFAGENQTEQEHLRSIILFGRNSASYKFAFARALLELSARGKEVVTLHELAEPYARYMREHVAAVDRQGTFAHSRFLDACRFFNAGDITLGELHDVTVQTGFTEVIDAFHRVRSADVPTRFFIDERGAGNRIRLTDALLTLGTTTAADTLALEAEARWRLVEESWSHRFKGQQIIVLYDIAKEQLVKALKGKRSPITSVRPALNGYQKGHCFYCFAPIVVVGQHHTTDVDHFLPHVLMSRGMPLNLDAPWNLVLSCKICNRGQGGKSALLPHEDYLERLYRRNEFLIGSNHPLRETLISILGLTPAARRAFLMDAMTTARPLFSTTATWTAPNAFEPLF